MMRIIPHTDQAGTRSWKVWDLAHRVNSLRGPSAVWPDAETSRTKASGYWSQT